MLTSLDSRSESWWTGLGTPKGNSRASKVKAVANSGHWAATAMLNSGTCSRGSLVQKTHPRAS